MMQRDDQRIRRSLQLALWWLAVALGSQSVIADDQAAYELLRQSHGDSVVMRAFERRLALIAEVRQDLEAAFNQHRIQALDDLLDDTLGVSALPAPSADSSEPLRGDTAVQILRRYSRPFAQPLSASTFTEVEQVILRERYSAAIREAGQRIAEQGRSVAATDPQQAIRAMALSLVLPLLHVPDDQWRREDLRGLPRWVWDGANLEQLEWFALRAHRPLTAFVIATEAALETGAAESPVRSVYLETTADRLLRDERFSEALTCLATAEHGAQERGDAKRTTELIFRQAQVLDDTGEPEKAAEVVARLLTDDAEPEVFGRGVMLRLKYLYGCGDPEQVVNESRLYQQDERVGGYLPQVLYITWVSARRAGVNELADQTRKDFHKRFPDHILGADLYFAEAMEALARSEYTEAVLVLEYISYRYPDSRLMVRVKKIQERLKEQADKQAEQLQRASEEG